MGTGCIDIKLSFVNFSMLKHHYLVCLFGV